MKKPKVLLLTSKCPSTEVSDSLGVPLGLHVLRRHLENNGIECDVFDHQLHPEQRCVSGVEGGHYDIVGFSVTHWRMALDLDFLVKLKEASRKARQNCLFIAGGVSATLNCRQWLECGFDLVCLGYVRDALLQLCSRFTHHRSKAIWELCDGLSGIAFLDKCGQVVFNLAPPLTNAEFEQYLFTDLMEMDLPYKEYWKFMRQRASPLLTMNKRSYIVENARLFTVNRCLANCGFCCCPRFFRTAQGSRAPFCALSPQQVLRLILHHIEKYGAKAFSFNDEDFLIGGKFGIERAIAICNLIAGSKGRGEMPEPIKFSCQTRPVNFFSSDASGNRLVNHELLRAMSRARFHNVSLGIETFCDRLTQGPSINKKNITNEHIHILLEELMNYGLYPTINLILGIPETTVDELLDTIRQTLQYTDRPCQISAADRMRAFPGADIFSLKNYPTAGTIWKNPLSGKTAYIPEYYVPHDKTVADILERLADAARGELEDFEVSNHVAEFALIPRIAIALCAFKAIAKMLNENELLQSVNKKLQEQASALTDIR